MPTEELWRRADALTALCVEGGADDSWVDRRGILPMDKLDIFACDILDEDRCDGHESAGSAPSIVGSLPGSAFSPLGALKADDEGYGASCLRLSPSPPQPGTRQQRPPPPLHHLHASFSRPARHHKKQRQI